MVWQVTGSSKPGRAIRRLENSYSSALNGYLFQIREGESDELHFSYAVHMIKWASYPIGYGKLSLFVLLNSVNFI